MSSRWLGQNSWLAAHKPSAASATMYTIGLCNRTEKTDYVDEGVAEQVKTIEVLQTCKSTRNNAIVYANSQWSSEASQGRVGQQACLQGAQRARAPSCASGQLASAFKRCVHELIGPSERTYPMCITIRKSVLSD